MRIEIEIDVDASLLKHDSATLRENVQKELKSSIQSAERTAKQIVPKRTGALAGSIHHGGSGLSWWAKTQLEYSDYIEEGTSAHLIVGNPILMSEPSHPDPLPGPVHSVFHPGNAAYKYMETALYMATEDLEERILRALTI